MKTSKVLLITTLIFALLAGGALTLQTHADTITAEVRCTPFTVALEDPITAEYRITIKLPKPYEHEDIDPDSLLVAGVVPMMDVPDWPKIKKTFFAFKIDGNQLMYWVILPYIWHTGVPPKTWVDIDMTVTGELYDGPSFEGAFTMRVRTESNDNSHGVPPP
jgi:hypothetical protein